MFRPFRAITIFGDCQPRALPWAVMRSPYRAKIFIPNRQQNFPIHSSNSTITDYHRTSSHNQRSCPLPQYILLKFPRLRKIKTTPCFFAGYRQYLRRSRRDRPAVTITFSLLIVQDYGRDFIIHPEIFPYFTNPANLVE
jgi:hypothetical protein